MNDVLQALAEAHVLSLPEAEQLDRMLDADALRAWAEQRIATVFAAVLDAQRADFIDLLQRDGVDVGDRALNTFWARQDRELWRAVSPVVQEVANEQSMALAARSGTLADWRAVNTGMIEWVEINYISGGFEGGIPGINDTARTQIGKLINDWQHGDLEVGSRAGGLPHLIAALEQHDAFSPARAARIAVTETTRIFAEGERAAALANEDVTQLTVLVSNDELVCETCGPLDGQTIPKDASGFEHPTEGNVGFPPFHVNCRCGISALTALAAGADA